jgi:hypothetical protein
MSFEEDMKRVTSNMERVDIHVKITLCLLVFSALCLLAVAGIKTWQMIHA